MFTAGDFLKRLHELAAGRESTFPTSPSFVHNSRSDQLKADSPRRRASVSRLLTPDFLTMSPGEGALRGYANRMSSPIGESPEKPATFHRSMTYLGDPEPNYESKPRRTRSTSMIYELSHSSPGNMALETDHMSSGFGSIKPLMRSDFEDASVAPRCYGATVNYIDISDIEMASKDLAETYMYVLLYLLLLRIIYTEQF
jgi:hypothetical protein